MCRKKRKKENSKQSFAASFHLSKWAHSAVVSPLTRDFHIRRLYQGCLCLSREKNPSPLKKALFISEKYFLNLWIIRPISPLKLALQLAT
jgi:hypothetical protein